MSDPVVQSDAPKPVITVGSDKTVVKYLSDDTVEFNPEFPADPEVRAVVTELIRHVARLTRLSVATQALLHSDAFKQLGQAIDSLRAEPAEEVPELTNVHIQDPTQSSYIATSEFLTAFGHVGGVVTAVIPPGAK